MHRQAKSGGNTLKDATAPHTEHPLFFLQLCFQRYLRRNVLFQTRPQNPLAFGRFSELHVYIVVNQLIYFISTLWVQLLLFAEIPHMHVEL